jgi:hypothetical protein
LNIQITGQKFCCNKRILYGHENEDYKGKKLQGQ